MEDIVKDGKRRLREKERARDTRRINGGGDEESVTLTD